MKRSQLLVKHTCHSIWPTYIACIAVSLFVSASTYSSLSQTIQGVVQNGTTGAPPSADLVVVVMGNKEIGRTVTDENGHFAINTPATNAAQGQMSIRVLHSGVTYSHPVRFDSPVSIPVYETSTSQSHVNEYMCVLQFQTRGGEWLEVTELHAIKNDFWPPHTITSAHNFNLSVPADASELSLAITEADGQGARLSFSGNEMRNVPKTLAVPLEPGLTKYVIKYVLPYSGHIAFERRLQYRTDKLFVIVAPGMQVAARRTLQFRSVEDQTGAQVREIDSLVHDFPVAIKLNGDGVLSHAFSPMASRGNNVTFPLRTDASSSGLVTRNTDAQIAAPASLALYKSGQEAAPKSWSVKWVVLTCALLLSIVLLGKFARTLRARRSS